MKQALTVSFGFTVADSCMKPNMLENPRSHESPSDWMFTRSTRTGSDLPFTQRTSSPGFTMRSAGSGPSVTLMSWTEPVRLVGGIAQAVSIIETRTLTQAIRRKEQRCRIRRTSQFVVVVCLFMQPTDHLKNLTTNLRKKALAELRQSLNKEHAILMC
jgi:hypothetical protein